MNTPKEIIKATKLLWLDVFLGVAFYSWEWLKPNHGLIESTFNLVANSIFLIGFIGFINFFILKAKGWVRWPLLFLVLFSLLGLLAPSIKNSTLAFTLTLITSVLEFWVLYILFYGEGKNWFKKTP